MHHFATGHRFIPALVATTVLALLAPTGAPAQASSAEEVLTNQTVVAMVAGKLGKDLILSKISSTRNEFDVSVSGIVDLHQNKVSRDIIRQMISASTDAALGRPDANSGEVMSNQGVVSMVGARVPKDLVLAKIANTANEFDVSVSGLVNLHQSKVSTDVMNAMLTAASDPALARSAAVAAEVLSNQSVVMLVGAKVHRSLILAKIQGTTCDFDVSANGMVSLKQNKVPEEVIKAMVVRAGT